MYEIEAKIKVDSLDIIREKLKEIGAKFIAERSQEDILFDDADQSMIKADSCLRLRKQVSSEGTKFILAYKGAKEKSNFKKRLEIEIEVNDSDSTQELISALGYEKKITVEKKRDIWLIETCEVALDQVKLLGDFVEIEGSDEKKINSVQKSLGLEQSKHIPKSYAAMIMDKLNQDDKK